MKRYEEWKIVFMPCEDVVCASVWGEWEDSNVDGDGWTP